MLSLLIYATSLPKKGQGPAVNIVVLGELYYGAYMRESILPAALALAGE